MKLNIIVQQQQSCKFENIFFLPLNSFCSYVLSIELSLLHLQTRPMVTLHVFLCGLPRPGGFFLVVFPSHLLSLLFLFVQSRKYHILPTSCAFLMDSSVTYINIVRGRKNQRPRQPVPSTLLALISAPGGLIRTNRMSFHRFVTLH
jgi:hypothetical protein